MNPNIKIYQLNENVEVDKYLDFQIELEINRLVSLGHSKEVALSVISFDKNDRDLKLLTAEINSKVVGIICYSSDSSLVTINLAAADSETYKNFLYSSLEQISKDQGCLYMKEKLSLKDVEKIEMLKGIGFNQECLCLFKRV